MKTWAACVLSAYVGLCFGSCSAKASVNQSDVNKWQYSQPKGMRCRGSQPVNTLYPFILLHPSEKQKQLILQNKK